MKDLEGRRKELEAIPEAKGLTVPVLEEVWHRSLEVAGSQPFVMVVMLYTEFCKVAQFAVGDLLHKLEAEGRLK